MMGRRARGFTLIEAVIVIAMVGVLGAIVAVFIRLPVQSYTESAARAEIGDEADLALRRMARELRLALPNSIRVNADGSAIEFLLTKTGGRYLAAEDGAAASFPVLDFLDPAKKSFTVVGQLGQAVSAGDYIVVYNLGPGMAPSDAWQAGGADRNIARVSGAVAAGTASPLITLDDNPFAAQSTPMPSPGRRFQVVSGPVMYACAAASDGKLVLTRSSNYAIAAAMAQPAAAASTQAPLTRRVANCAGIFSYASAESQRSALVGLTLELVPREGGSSAIRLVHQVHVDNTP